MSDQAERLAYRLYSIANRIELLAVSPPEETYQLTEERTPAGGVEAYSLAPIVDVPQSLRDDLDAARYLALDIGEPAQRPLAIVVEIETYLDDACRLAEVAAMLEWEFSLAGTMRKASDRCDRDLNRLAAELRAAAAMQEAGGDDAPTLAPSLPWDAATEARNRHVYEMVMSGAPYKAIVADVASHKEWDAIETIQAVAKIARRYAVVHSLRIPPRRQRGRPTWR